KMAFGAADLDPFGGWASSSNTYTVARDGIYLCHAVSAWSSAASDTTQRVTGITVNGQIYWGPGYVNAPVTTVGGVLPQTGTASTKTQIFSLRAGDTVTAVCRQNSGSAVHLSSGDESRLFLAWLGAPGIPPTLWDPPDTSFRWQAGLTGDALAAAYAEHFGNDLGFLVQRPYLLSWQSSAGTESGLSQNNWHRVNMDQVTGQAHGGGGDSYSGWDAANFQYVSQRAGWYLCVSEVFSTFPLSPPAAIIAGFSVPSSGGWNPVRAPDWYQHQLSTPANFTPGATAVGLYYLLPGESISPQIQVQDNGGSFGTTSGTVNSGTVASHFEVVWLCE